MGDGAYPVYSERGPDGGFSLVRGYKMPPLVFTPEEAVAVFLGTGLVAEMWGQLYARRYATVAQCIGSIRGWPRPPIPSATLTPTQSSISTRRQTTRNR